MTAPALDHLRDRIDRAVRDGEVAGIAIGAGGAAVPTSWVSAGRLALDSNRAMAPDTICRIASMTKIVTGLAAMILVEDGKLSLDQPVDDIDPAFAAMRVATGPQTSVPAQRPITVRHLLDFTAGIPHVWQPGPAPEAYRRAGLDGVGHHAVMPRRPEDAAFPGSLAEYAGRVARLPLHAQPGVQWDYGFSLEVMGHLIERVSGMRFDRVLAERLFAPLGKKDTAFFVPPGKLDRLASCYQRIDGTLQVWDDRRASRYVDATVMPSPSGGLVSTGRDYARFCRMLLNGGELDGVRIAGARAVRAATTNLLPADVPRPEFVLDGADWGAGVAIQTAASVTPGENTVGTYGWAGGTGGTAFWVDPAAGSFVVVMMQRMMGDPNDSFHRELARAAMLDLQAQ